MHKIKESELNFFCERVKYWQEKLNLMNWRIDVYAGKVENGDAGCLLNTEGRTATMIINQETEYGWDLKKLDKSAFHECCEILLGKLATFAQQAIAESDVAESVHEIIRILENVVNPVLRGELKSKNN